MKNKPKAIRFDVPPPGTPLPTPSPGLIEGMTGVPGPIHVHRWHEPPDEADSVDEPCVRCGHPASQHGWDDNAWFPCCEGTRPGVDQCECPTFVHDPYVLAEIEAERDAVTFHGDPRDEHWRTDPAPVPPAGAPAIGTRWRYNLDKPREVIATVATVSDRDVTYDIDGGGWDVWPVASWRESWTEHPPENAPAIGTTWRYIDNASQTVGRYTKASTGEWAVADADGGFIFGLHADGTIRYPEGWSQVVPEPEPDRPTRTFRLPWGGLWSEFDEFTLVDTPYGQVLVLKDGDR